jgi:hypothetical protein
MTAAPFVHPEGFYKEFPAVTWDLAEERWLGSHDRSDLLIAVCLSCKWSGGWESGLVLAKPERRRIAEFIEGARHSYECPDDPRMVFGWFKDVHGSSWSEEMCDWIHHLRAWQGESELDLDEWIKRLDE